jgi:hypothetical protein
MKIHAQSGFYNIQNDSCDGRYVSDDILDGDNSV